MDNVVDKARYPLSAQLAEAARTWAAELAALPTVAVGYMKRNLNTGLRGSLSDVLDAVGLGLWWCESKSTRRWRQAGGLG
jgi:enoyl-CoA hydratase/carnithine racemase